MKLLNQTPTYLKVQGHGVLLPNDTLEISDASVIIKSELGSGYAEIYHQSDSSSFQIRNVGDTGLHLLESPKNTFNVHMG